MMKTPFDVTEKIAELGERIAHSDATQISLAEEGAIWLRDHQALFALGILEDWFSKQLRSWIYKQTREVLGDAPEWENRPLPFPELPAYIEVAPGVKKHQNATVRKDWENCIAIVDNRADQANILSRAYHRCFDALPPNFQGDVKLPEAYEQLQLV
jgi:hypothetical protein